MARKRSDRPGFTRRILLLGGAETLVFSALVDRLYRLQVVDHTLYRKQARNNAIVERPLAPARGLITDRAGVMLADNRQQWRALFLSVETHDPRATIAQFVRLVGLSAGENLRIAGILAGAPRYVPIILKENLDWAEMARLEAHAPALPGVIIDRGLSRVYPLGVDAAHTVGHLVRPTTEEVAQDPVLAVPGSRVGGSGVERAHNAVLFGKPGVVETEVDARGSAVQILHRSRARQGRTVSLTLDATLQRGAANALHNRVGAAVLLDVRDGAVLAMASSPSFDPTLFDRGVPDPVWSRWMNDPMRPLTDRATQGLYAPGSSFKPTVALAALRCGAITAETRFFCPGHLKIGNRIFYCWLRSGHGWMDVASALQQSCDVFYYHVAMRTGIDRMAAMGKRLGLIGAPKLDFPNLAAGFLPTHAWAQNRDLHWTEGDTAVEGIGQGYTLLTPLNLATMIARVCTGRAITPYLVREIGDEALQRQKALTIDLDSRHITTVRHGLAEVVNTPLGTAWGARLRLPSIRMAGKTGTAQVINEDKAMEAANYDDARLPWKYRPNALFVAYAPIEVPRFAAAVVIEHGALLAPVQVARDLFSVACKKGIIVG